MQHPDISVVVCTYNRAAVLRIALASLLAQETEGAFTYEIVAVDDASPDDTPQVIEEAAAQAPVPMRRVAGAGAGVAAARNAGVAAARGNWIAFTDDDQRNDPRWLVELWRTAQATGADCVGGGVELELAALPEYPLTGITAAILGQKRNPEGPIEQLMQCPGTGNVMFARHVFQRLDGFDTELVWGGEDAEFMLRLLNAGMRVYFNPRAVVHHLIPESRTRVAYFRWASRRVGVALAEVDGRVRGKPALAARCAARLLKGALVFVPKLAYARSRGDGGRVLEARCLVWRLGTYTRHTAHLLAPRWFPQAAFYASLQFRAERAAEGQAG